MKFGEEWLRKWINTSISSMQLVEQLTMTGIEVEHILIPQPIFKNIFIAKIVSKKIHPKNNNYYIYKVELNNIYKNIITHKKINLFIGLKIPVAIEGSKLASGKLIQSLIIDGYLSDGIFCSYRSLGFNLKDNSIITLSKSIEELDFEKYLSLYKFIFNFSIPANRLDLHSVIGIARDISIINHLPLPNLKYNSYFSDVHTKKLVKIDISNLNITYIFREIFSINMNIDIPFYIKERLRNSGIFINNALMNIVYYVYLETGCWFHIFDSDKLNGNLCIRYLKNTDQIISLKNKDIIQNSKLIVISDEKNLISLEDMEYIQFSNIDDNTKNIMLGAIFFDPDFIKNKKKLNFISNKPIKLMKYNIFTDIKKYSFEYISKLILKIFGGKITVPKIMRVIKNKYRNISLKLNIKKINSITGYKFSKEVIKKILTICYFKYFYISGVFFISPPFWRLDITVKEDIIHEIIKIYGFNKILKKPFVRTISTILNSSKKYSLNKLKLNLVYKGYLEIISYSFVNPKIQKLFFSTSQFLKIINPISNDMSVMRMSLWIGLIQCIAYNFNRQQESIRIFESGLCFFKNKSNDSKIIQEEYLAGAISGNINHRVWYTQNREFDFYDLKGDLESILNICGKLKFVSFISKKFDGLRIDQSAGIFFLDTLIGKIGVLDPSLYDFLNLKKPIILFELSLKHILLKKDITYKPISDFPIIQRDISIIVSEYVTVGEIISICENTIKSKYVKIYVYDVYRGLGIKSGEKSISICFIFKSMLNTLIEYDINIKIEKCIATLKNKCQAVLRE